jgi:hypothetical protein
MGFLCVWGALRRPLAAILDRGALSPPGARRPSCGFCGPSSALYAMPSGRVCPRHLPEVPLAGGQLGPKLIFTKPYTPQTNGKLSASSRPRSANAPTLQPFEHSDQRGQALPPFLHCYKSA